MDEVLKAIADLEAKLDAKFDLQFTALGAAINDLQWEVTYGRQKVSTYQAFEDRVVQRVIERMEKRYAGQS